MVAISHARRSAGGRLHLANDWIRLAAAGHVRRLNDIGDRKLSIVGRVGEWPLSLGSCPTLAINAVNDERQFPQAANSRNRDQVFGAEHQQAWRTSERHLKSWPLAFISLPKGIAVQRYKARALTRRIQEGGVSSQRDDHAVA